MSFIPAEVEIWGTYVPPLLINATLGVILMVITVNRLNRYRLSRFFMFPDAVMLSLAAIYTVILSTWVFPT